MFSRLIWGARVSLVGRRSACSAIGHALRRHARPRRRLLPGLDRHVADAVSTSSWPSRPCPRSRHRGLPRRRPHDRRPRRSRSCRVPSVRPHRPSHDPGVVPSASSCWPPGPQGASDRPHPVPRDPAQRAAGHWLAIGAARRRPSPSWPRAAWPSSALSVSPRRPRWGVMINAGREPLQTDAPLSQFIPSVVIFLTVMALNFLGDGLRAALRRPGERPVSEHGSDASDGPAGHRRPTDERRRPLLEVDDLKTHFHTAAAPVRAVDGVSLHARAGQDPRHRGRVGLGQVGAVPLDHGPAPAATSTATGQRPLRGPRAHRHARRGACASCWGTEMAMVFQDPMTSLNPVHARSASRSPSRSASTSTWPRSEADETARRAAHVGRHPRARAPPRASTRTSCRAACASGSSIAIALACGPKLLFADEPTTALDVTVQAQILDLLQDQQRERHMAMILVTHDLGVVAGRADEIAVMYAGQIVEQAPDADAVRADAAPRTPRRCCSSIPKLDDAEPHPARRHRRPPAGPRQPAAGLPVRAALPLRPGPVPHRGAAADRGRRRPGHVYRCWFPVDADGPRRPRAQPRRRRAGRAARRRRRRRRQAVATARRRGDA